MGRTTTVDVGAVISTTLDITPFIAIANVFVTDRLSDQGLSSEILAEIERWITAHFISVRVPLVKSRSIDGASESYHLPNVSVGGLNSTIYGQQAVMLDSSGTLASMGKRKMAFDAIDISVD